MTHTPYVPVSQLTFDPAILALIPESVAREKSRVASFGKLELNYGGHSQSA